MENRLSEFESESHEHDFVISYILKNTSPPMGWKAVYAQYDRDNGVVRLEALDLDLIGVASVVTREFCGLELIDKFTQSRVVGIHIINGVSEIANESANFAGLMPPGADMETCTADLPDELYSRLPAHIRSKNPRSG